MFKDIDILYLFNLDGKTFHEQALLQSKQIRHLKANFQIASVFDRTIKYKEEFNIHALRENLAGKLPIQTFEESGFDLDRSVSKRQTMRGNGGGRHIAFMGKKNFCKRDVKNQILEVDRKKMIPSTKAEARVKHLTAENELLKKLEAFETNGI